MNLERAADGVCEVAVRPHGNDARFQVVGRLRTTMTNFGFDPPSVAGLTTVRNGVTIEVKLTFVLSS